MTYGFKLDGADTRRVIAGISTGHVAHHLGGDVVTSSQRAFRPAWNPLTNRSKALTTLADTRVIL